MKNPKKLPKDANKRAFEIVKLSTEEPEEPTSTAEKTPAEDERSEISKYLAEIGRKGGLKGGKARADSLSAKRRKEIATRAANSRWQKKQS
jgi:hypothetical protein